MMKKSTSLSYLRFWLGVSAVLSSYFLLSAFAGRKTETMLDVRIFTPSPGDTVRLNKYNLKVRRKHRRFVDASVTESAAAKMQEAGFAVALRSAPPRNPTLPLAYKSIEEIVDTMQRLQARFPDIVHLEKIGRSTTLGLPIWAARISDHADTDEDEPTMLFMGVHHAREPIGANICLELMKQLCENYGRNPRFTTWVDAIEIWFVPVVNPDGYKYVYENNLGFPWWRKNLRDNDGDGIFNPLYDGVDLNRNYDYNWQEGGDGKPGSWFYRGRQPFSENETRAIMHLALRENFAIGISYHSYGESILFPWGNYKSPPDLDLIVDIAGAMAAHITRESGRGNYSILPLNGRVGQSSIWMYGELRTIDFIVEVGTEYFPPQRSVPSIVRENVRGALYLLDRILETGVKGHVFDEKTGAPLHATVEVRELAAPYVKPRAADGKFGSFYRILGPGVYTLEVKSQGYKTRVMRGVRVKKGQFVDLNIPLQRAKSLTNGRSTN